MAATCGLFYAITGTAAGWLGILGSEAGLVRVALPRRDAAGVLPQLGIGRNQATLAPTRFQGVMARLRAYFDGQKVSFPDAVDVTAATPFQRQVWAAARLIPYGETRSYAWVAGQIGRPGAARAVGQALGRNPLPIIVPCHRVLASDGGPGGYSGGLAMKGFLLRLEAAEVPG